MEIKFVYGKGPETVSAIWLCPEKASSALVLGHGAGSNMRHATLQSLADACATVGVATLRYNFPYSEYGRGRDSQELCVKTIGAAVLKAQELAPDLPLLAGGHSFGGRMTSHAAAEGAIPDVRGLVFFSFPLHLPGKPATKRADHLDQVHVPMLFISGTRDEFADLNLLRPVAGKLGKQATLHVLDTADHGYKVLKRSRASTVPVFQEIGNALREWINLHVL